MSELFDLTGKVALVTGGTRGLGYAMAHAFADHGADVIVASRKPDACARVAAEIAAKGRRSLGYPCHVAYWDQVTALAAAAYDEFGRVDVLVNNAGLSPLYPSLAEVTEELFDKVVGINLKGPFRLSALIGERMAAGDGGSIINISSTAAEQPSPEAEPYGAAKAGLNSLTRSLAFAYGPKVRVNCIEAGPFLTDISKAWDMPAFEARAKSSMALQRGGRPGEIVGAALYLASDAGSFTTGSVLRVDGGAPMTKLSTLSRSIAGKVALVTGAASGMGRATAFVLADEGAHVAVTDINDVGPVVQAITEAGGSAHGWRLDVGDAAAIARVVPAVAERFGGLDILINNAGLPASGQIDDEDFEATWERALTVMLTAHQRTIRAALPYLRRAEHPRIVNIASTEGLGATKWHSPYAAAKTGVIGLTRALAVDLGREGITVNCICPGPIRTGMTEAIPEADKQLYARRRVALKRYADPEEVAHMTVSLCLPAAGFTTGVTLPVDGGLTIKNA